MSPRSPTPNPALSLHPRALPAFVSLHSKHSPNPDTSLVTNTADTPSHPVTFLRHPHRTAAETPQSVAQSNRAPPPFSTPQSPVRAHSPNSCSKSATNLESYASRSTTRRRAGDVEST